MTTIHERQVSKSILATIAALIVLPLFFHVNGTIFNDPSYSFSSMGDLNRLPLPVSLVACLCGLPILKAFRKAKTAWYTLVATLIVMVATTVFSTKGLKLLTVDKLLLLVQFVLPMSALVLGQAYSANTEQQIFFKTALLVVLSIIPVQVLTTFISGNTLLPPSVLFFSIYQHLQYVPTIFISLYLIGLFLYWDNRNFRKVLIFSAPLVGIYAQLSLSMLTNFALYSGIGLFSGYRWIKNADKLPVVFTICIVAASVTTYWHYKQDDNFLQKYNFQKSSIATDAKQHHSNVTGRIRIWEYYIEKMSTDLKIFFIGSVSQPSRAEFPSAHNYYLDLTYNFGFLSLIPILALLWVTLRAAFDCRRTILASQFLIAFTYITLFLLIVDSSLKVSLRQPYPGVVTFFLWGSLLSNLKKARHQYSLTE